MQVQRIQNNNNYNTNFGAKLQTNGMSNLPEKSIENFKQLAKLIGSKKDIVAIHLKDVTKETTVWHEMGNRYVDETLWQNIDTATYINGIITPMRIKALVTSKELTLENIKSIENTIVEFFNTLIHGEKQVVESTKPKTPSINFVLDNNGSGFTLSLKTNR